MNILVDFCVPCEYSKAILMLEKKESFSDINAVFSPLNIKKVYVD